MAGLKLINLQKKFGNNAVVDKLNVDIKDGEFVTFLGPSGCGKTTTLRMVAGFIKPTKGSISIDGKIISSYEDNTFLPPDKRDMGMVFQTYAVWPHMNVFKNIAYPLKFKKYSKKETKERVSVTLSLVKLEGFEDRFPHQMSGGQQQRVALARAVVMEPSVLLLDEPLSNLDAKLRESMRYEIVELQQRLAITVVYVTHDQIEAMSMSDRVVVMDQGIVQQIGSPQNVYQNPSNKFVANFIGMANFIPCEIVNREKSVVRVKLNDGSGKNFLTVPVINEKDYSNNVTVVIRPEDIDVLPSDGQEGTIGTLVRQTYIGDRNDCTIQFGDVLLRVHTQNKFTLNIGEEVKLVLSNPVLLNT
ncbi:MAG: ABC transporter ATP-binding protein [Anaerolineaceae bacterium]|nr:ABC transporter ATP-binding protein [Anaerolineaceae bacterium]